MVAGCHSGVRVGTCAGVCVLLLLCGIASAARAAGPRPPTTAEFERATERLLAKPAFSPRARAGGGGVGPGGGSGTDSGDAIFPDNIYLTMYGAPQLPATEVGKRSPKGAVEKAIKQSKPYERKGDREVVSGIDLIGTVATSSPGPDGKYRTRQPDPVISSYLDEVRNADGRLMLDIQPGRSSPLKEIVALKKWIVEPDVDIGIDPEWNVGPKGVPGEDSGSVTATEINKASLKLDTIVENENLPPKVLIVHQFTKRMIKNRNAIKQRDGVQVLLNFDGIGTPKAKEAGFAALANEGLFNGYSIFYSLDTMIVRPRSVLKLLPTVDFLLYQ